MFPIIDYIEVRQKSDREIIGIIDSAKSVIWHSVYYGVGDFEIYAPATERHLQLLQEGNYVTRPNDIEIGVIEAVSVTMNAQDGTMIIASGRFAKSILDRRHIYRLGGRVNHPTILSGKVETAVRSVVANNAISCTFDSARNIPFLELGELSNIPAIIVDGDGNPAQKQVSYQNLLTYTDEVLAEYSLGATVTIDDETRKLQYSVYIGADRSVDNTQGNEPVVFSPEYDNLIESEYLLDTTTKKTAALIGGEGEGLLRFYSLIKGTKSGIDRRETWVDASSISQEYEEGGQTQRYTDAEYKAMLDAEGRQVLATLEKVETFAGTINATGGIWKLNEHYMLGDIVTVQDNKISKYANVRITEITEAQDENGYTVQITYQS